MGCSRRGVMHLNRTQLSQAVVCIPQKGKQQVRDTSHNLRLRVLRDTRSAHMHHACPRAVQVHRTNRPLILLTAIAMGERPLTMQD